eukprot:2150490-Rhodomonas_salina.1
MGGLLLHEIQIVGSIVRYQLLEDTMDRAKYSKLYNALKEHLRMFHRSSYDEFQKLMWINSTSILYAIFGSDWLALSRKLLDTLVSSLTLGPSMVGKVLMDTFLGNVTNSINTDGSGLPVVLICGFLIVIGVIAEAMIAYKSNNYKPLVMWAVSEMNKLFGFEKSQSVMNALKLVQSPLESFAAFSNLSKYKSLEEAIKENKSEKGLRRYVYGLLDELEKNRVAHRMSTSWSSFMLGGYRKKKRK